MLRLPSAVLLIFLLAASAQAQTGVVSGTVVDQSDAFVPGATVMLSSTSVHEMTMTDGEGAYRFRNIAAGTYQLVVSLDGFSTVTQDVTLAGSELTVPAVKLVLAGIGETVVVSASKVESVLLNAPATLTVIPGSTLASSPAQNFGDLLRSVPGMNVVQTSARDVNLTSRQATGTLATSQLALLDGRSIYLDFFGLILWDLVPTNADDIKQIEVVRGPASAVWGANALTGVVNIITKSPREAPGTSVTFSVGAMDRDAGSTKGKGVGSMFSAGVTTSQVLNDRWSYRLSAGYFNSDPYPRPTGRVPVITDPRDPTGKTTVGGAFYPLDGPGAFGTAFANTGTSQPKFDARVDQELKGATVTYAGGIAGTEGTIYTGIGPFDLQRGSVMGYGKMNYSRGALKFNVFANIVHAEAPNLLLPDPLTSKPLQLNFKTGTYDVEVGHAKVLQQRHTLSYGGNLRRNNFDMTLAPNAKNRNEIGAYFQDEIFVDKFRFSLGARVDKFGNLKDPFFSPRLTVMFLPITDQTIRVSFNRAFRSPSTINNYLDVSLVTPADLSALAPLLPAQLRPAVATPFPLLVHAVGSELPIGATPQAELKPTSIRAYEIAYNGSIQKSTMLGAAFYVNDVRDEINFVQLPSSLDPYTAANPPPGWVLPPAILQSMAQLGIFLPRTAFTYLNLGPLRNKGVELSVDHRFNSTLSAFANYSWQGKPEVLKAANPYPAIELALPPTNRFNIGGTYNGRRYIGNLTVNFSDKAFWSDVLTSTYHGYTDSFTMVGGTFGMKWMNGKITTSVKTSNLLNQTIQQHVFGDLIRRSVTGEVRIRM